MRLFPWIGTAALFALLGTQTAFGQVKIGVTISSTGPAASLGIPEKNAVLLMPTKIGQYDVQYLVLDDASDPSLARRNIMRFTTEDHVDAIIGSSTTPASLGMIEIAGQSGTPMISLGAGTSIIAPMDQARHWVFKTPYNDATTARATVGNMRAKGFKKIAFIGFNDGYGESWLKELRQAMASSGIDMVASERYMPADTTVTAQILKVIAARPDAVLIAASGTPAVTPQASLREHGYRGVIYQTTGVANEDFVRVGGKNVEGTLIAGAPVTVAQELPAGHPARTEALKFDGVWSQKYGANSMNAFAGYAWDAYLLLQPALLEAGKHATPGTANFRSGIRDALEQSRQVATTNGVVNMSSTDHNGYAPSAPAFLSVDGGRWHLAK
jgi:branched-chain amino acid transport system substrate-binding protein